MTQSSPNTPSVNTLISYSGIGIALAFAGLPIYVHVPHYYATTHQVALVEISIALLLVRFIDAFQDPLIGLLSDRATMSRRKIIGIATLPLIVSFVGLFTVPSTIPGEWLAYWMFAMLLVVYSSFSIVIINFYAAGLMLSDDSDQQTKISAFREGTILIGVIFAAALPTFLTEQYDDATAYHYFSLLFIPVALLGCAATIYGLRHVPASPVSKDGETPSIKEQLSLIHNSDIRRILTLFFVNSIPTAITSTLFLFYVEDRLGAKSEAGMMLLCYFAAAAISVAGWNRATRSLGKHLSLLIGMILATISFVWAYTLGVGDIVPFYIICAVSGIAIGADLTIMPSLYSEALNNHDASQAGAGFSLWHFLNKLNLSLAAGVVLPLLAWLGYEPSQTASADDTLPLSIAYALIPCLFKCLAIFLLWRLHRAQSSGTSHSSHIEGV